MSVRHEIRRSTLWFVVEGDYGLDEMRGAAERALSDPGFRDGFAVLIDVRETPSSPSRQLLEETVHFLASLRPRMGPRWAVVAGDLLHYGLGRMFGTFADFRGVEVQVFDDPSRAEAWLAREFGPQEA